MYDRDFVAVGIAFGDFEFVGDLDTGDPDDLAVPDEQRNAVTLFDGDLAIDEDAEVSADEEVDLETGDDDLGVETAGEDDEV